MGRFCPQSPIKNIAKAYRCLVITQAIVFSFSSIGGHNEQENTLNQLLVEMDGKLNKYQYFLVVVECTSWHLLDEPSEIPQLPQVCCSSEWWSMWTDSNQ